MQNAASDEQSALLEARIVVSFVDDLTWNLPDLNEAESLISISNEVIGPAGMRLRSG